MRLAEDAWNTRDAERVALAYTEDSLWRNRAEGLSGRAEITAFLKRTWAAEQEYRLVKKLWAFTGDRIAVRFACEYRASAGDWFRAYGNGNWAFALSDHMRLRIASINDLAITEQQRLFRWPQGRRPGGHPGLSELGLCAGWPRKPPHDDPPGRRRPQHPWPRTGFRRLAHAAARRRRAGGAARDIRSTAMLR